MILKVTFYSVVTVVNNFKRRSGYVPGSRGGGGGGGWSSTDAASFKPPKNIRSLF